ncbi:hypothetical protein HDU76_005864 [Blyttiomyces sp. JEL0837]|nr:hypothetical protein HDU76_005864 [Blyttiomyces sp. JEL0837]
MGTDGGVPRLKDIGCPVDAIAAKNEHNAPSSAEIVAVGEIGAVAIGGSILGEVPGDRLVVASAVAFAATVGEKMNFVAPIDYGCRRTRLCHHNFQNALLEVPACMDEEHRFAKFVADVESVAVQIGDTALGPKVWAVHDAVTEEEHGLVSGQPHVFFDR